MRIKKQNLKISILITLSLTLLGLISLSGFSMASYGEFYEEDIDKAIYVSKDGSDSGLGSFSRPYKTIQYAVDRLEPGQSLYIMEGVYYEKIKINSQGSRNDGYITIRPYGDDEVILDGSRTSGSDMIEIYSKSYIIIKDLILRNNVNRFSTGVSIKNGARHIEINGLEISRIDTSMEAGSPLDGGSNAIISVSNLEDKPNYDIRILNNHIHDCHLGRSEAITVTQNTKKFQVINNIVHDVTNIGIDIAGHHGDFEGNPSLNQARDGIISDNIIYNARSLYGSGAASGLYVDGGRDLILERNIVYNNDYGLTVGCENPDKSSSNVIVRNNIVHNNDKSGISIGGYNDEVGTVEDSHIYNNLSYSNNKFALSSHAELSIKKTSGKIQVYNNIFYQSKANNLELPIIRTSVDNEEIDINYNLYFSSDQVSNVFFRYGEDRIYGFNNYRLKSGFDSKSLFANPLLKLIDNRLLSYDEATPVIDIGNPYYQYKGDVDLNKRERSINDLFDAGPVEVGSKIQNYVFDNESILWTDSYDSNKLLIKSDHLTISFAFKSDLIGLKQQFYFDTDKKLSTGFKNDIIPGIGAEYLVEGGILYVYSGDGNSWNWTRLEALYYVDYKNQIIGSANLSSLELLEDNEIKIGFITSRDFSSRDGLIFDSRTYKIKENTN